MRFLIVDTVYQGFLLWLYNEFSPGLAGRSYAQQLETQVQGFFHTAGAWRPALEKLGHEVMEVTANNTPQQLRWMIENDLLDKAKTLSDGLVFGGYVLRQHQELNWQIAILAEQVKKFRPDVLLCANLYLLDNNFLNIVQGYYGKAIGQHAAVMPENSLTGFDAIFSSLPNQVDAFRKAGIRSELIGLAFDERLLPHLKDEGYHHDVAFIGSVSLHHQGRAQFLKDIASARPIDVWGDIQWPDTMDTSGLQIRANPPVFGLPMYQTMRSCRMVLNYHLDAAGAYANNLRLFEVTGVGSVLVTDNKRNIRDYFEPGLECVVFDTASECLAKIQHLQSHPDEAAAIARAGQARTLRDHTYHNRVAQLMDLVL